MKIVVIEDEPLVADELEQNLLTLLNNNAEIIKIESVHNAILHFENNPAPDLIFSDIQLGDGLSFEIFVSVQLNVPVIFCTAYDTYALEAFKANGIDYILKPFTIQMLEAALTKYKQFSNLFSKAQVPQYEALLRMLDEKPKQRAASVLVYHQDKIIPIKIEEVALFYLKNETTHLMTFGGKIYYPNKNLDELERLSGKNFYRANRQALVCRDAIIDVSHFFSRKLSLNLKVATDEKVIVSKAKSSQFLAWLAEH
ncbi:DNA-binding response regulator [Mucilaginibacter sp. MD40]|uniref:LytR/AlgR family response regulator transcription factor n=1 Tax=Mucilaginibacter sp. MD40 TaxID=2029590 RepID=UPI000BACAF12|nr:LytTR family DNA-binding domain-containing protein [Mucilaginibacter sp. MD40]PAW92323.1 DNA-binding response regulator [Mucilaginibacter sp. MD40]